MFQLDHGAIRAIANPRYDSVTCLCDRSSAMHISAANAYGYFLRGTHELKNQAPTYCGNRNNHHCGSSCFGFCGKQFLCKNHFNC